MPNHNLPRRVNGRQPGGQKIIIVTCSWWKAVTLPLRNTLGTSKRRKGIPATDRVGRKHCFPAVRNKYALGASTLGEGEQASLLLHRFMTRRTIQRNAGPHQSDNHLLRASRLVSAAIRGVRSPRNGIHEVRRELPFVRRDRNNE